MKALNDDCERFESFPPGHIYSSKEGGLRRWYNPPWYSEKIPSTPYDPLVLRQAFEHAVIKRLMTDVPFGVLLSGGLDSSLVAAVASRHLASTKAAKQWGAQLHSFCVGLKGSPDLKAAKEVAEYLGTVHHEFHFTVQVAEISRILRPGGVFVATTFLASSFVNSLVPDMLKPFRQAVRQATSSYTYLTEKELEDLCKSCGFVDYSSTTKQSFIMLSARKPE